MSTRREIFLKFMMKSFFDRGVRSEATNRFASVHIASFEPGDSWGRWLPAPDERARPHCEPLSGTSPRNLKANSPPVREWTARTEPLPGRSSHAAGAPAVNLPAQPRAIGARPSLAEGG